MYTCDEGVEMGANFCVWVCAMDVCAGVCVMDVLVQGIHWVRGERCGHPGGECHAALWPPRG